MARRQWSPRAPHPRVEPPRANPLPASIVICASGPSATVSCAPLPSRGHELRPEIPHISRAEVVTSHRAFRGVLHATDVSHDASRLTWPGYRRSIGLGG